MKTLPKNADLNKVHDWWNYGIHPILGYRHTNKVAINERKKYYKTPLRYDQED